MIRRAKPTRYRLSAHPDVVDDLASLALFGPAAVAAARTVLDDLAHGRVTAKRRHPSCTLNTVWAPTPPPRC